MFQIGRAVLAFTIQIPPNSGSYVERWADGSYFLYAHFAGNVRVSTMHTVVNSCARVDKPSQSQSMIALTAIDEDWASPPDCFRRRANS